jgi:nucleotide-binding universal stress UspA family protein
MLITAGLGPRGVKWNVWNGDTVMKILLAIDGSECSKSAIESLINQYQPAQTEVLVVHAVESAKLTPVPYSYGVGPVFVQDYAVLARQWREEGREIVSQACQRLQAAGFTTNTQMEEGDARDVILDWAEKWHPDLILLGSHGKRGLDRLLLGSVSEAIARHAHCSVEIVRAPASAA